MYKVPIVTRDPANPRKIPTAVFIENTEQFVTQYTAELTLECL